MFYNARVYIKTAFAFFVAGILSGLYLYGAKIFTWPIPFTLASAHSHLLLMGGVYLMILGVAVWFFPRPQKEDKKYNPTRISWFYWIFTLSTSIRFIAEILYGLRVSDVFQLFGFICACLQVLAAIGLVYSLWGRIRPIGSKVRESSGERF